MPTLNLERQKGKHSRHRASASTGTIGITNEYISTRFNHFFNNGAWDVSSTPSTTECHERAEPAQQVNFRIVPAMLVFALAFSLRYFHLKQSFDVFSDEIIYSNLAESVSQHHSVAFFGVPFFLHPPFVFLEQALFIRAFNVHGGIVSVVYSLRLLNIILASFSAVVLLRLGTRVGSPVAGVIAAVLFSIDPFVIRFDSRVFLEPSALLWVMMGYLLLFNSLTLRGRVKVLSGIAAGVLMGIGVLSNEMATPLIVIPLGTCLVANFPYQRRSLVPSAVAFVSVIFTYLAALAAFGQFTNFVSQQTSGILRLVGASQQTGFNKPGAPSFISRVIVHLSGYGAVYAVLGLAIVPTFYFLLKGSPSLRLISLVGLSAYTVISYQIFVGTLEEQMFYYVDVPAILILALGIDRLIRTRPQIGRTLTLSILTGAAVICLMTVDTITWVQIHTAPDAGLVSAIDWVNSNVGAGTKIAPLVDTSELLVGNYQVYLAESPAEIERDRPAFVITSSLQVAQGYGFATPRLIRWLRANAITNYESTGRTFGTVIVWKTKYPSSVEQPPGPPGPNSPLPTHPVGQG